MSTQLVGHAPLVVSITVVHEGLEVLNIVVVAVELELDDLQLTIRDLHILKLKVHVGLQTDSLVLVGEVVVVRDRQQGLHGRKSGDVVNHSIHAIGVETLDRGLVVTLIHRRTALTGNGGPRCLQDGRDRSRTWPVPTTALC